VLRARPGQTSDCRRAARGPLHRRVRIRDEEGCISSAHCHASFFSLGKKKVRSLNTLSYQPEYNRSSSMPTEKLAKGTAGSSSQSPEDGTDSG
jgi:hypothetical protein